MDNDKLFDISKELQNKLPEQVFKRGYFLLTTKKTSNYWIDLYALSHMFNASEQRSEYREFLKAMVEKIVLHQATNFGVNSVIIPRWTCCTEDLFSETLLNVCFDLFGTESREQVNDTSEKLKSIAVLELFSAGGVGHDMYLNQVKFGNKSLDKDDDINAVAFLALDIHTWLMDYLLEDHALKIQSVISLIGRCGQYPNTFKRKSPNERSEFCVFPLFDASEFENKDKGKDKGKNEGEVKNTFIFINENEKLKIVKSDEGKGSDEYIPFDTHSILI
ncbi:hypothetical protein FACS1894202_07610 [Clostridia bacterium]|nr:hypothetical protein FACS1894202_07610 [Clostridia bacterium]